ncbi:MAG TPA: hypothetical protein PKA27_16520 [Fimbriimonadaceae bacterium]|nr:hypothetical protein [Fimbriimonadaceae bacterium]
MPIVEDHNEGEQPIPEFAKLPEDAWAVRLVHHYHHMLVKSSKEDGHLLTISLSEFRRVTSPLEELLLQSQGVKVNCTSCARVGPHYFSTWLRRDILNAVIRFLDEQTMFVKSFIAREMQEKRMIADVLPVYLKGKPLDDWLEIVPFRVQTMYEVDRQDEFRICRYAPHRYLLAPSKGHEIFDWTKIWPIELKPFEGDE